MAGHGGKRKGAGRPEGSITRLQFRAQLTPEQIEALLDKALEKAEAGTA
jgi:hypothetical protein